MYKEADQFGTYTAIPGSKPVNRYVSNSTYDLSNSWYARQMDMNLRNTATGKSHPEISPTVAATNLSVAKRPGMKGVVDDPLLDRVAEQQQQAANDIMQQRQLRPTLEQQQHINRFWNESSFYNRRNAKGQAFDLNEPVLDQSITDPNMRQIVIDTGKGMANNFTPNNIYKDATVLKDTNKDYYNMNKYANNYVPGDSPSEWAVATAGGAIIGGGIADHFDMAGGDILKERAIGGAVGALSGAALLALATHYYKHGYKRGIASANK